MRKSYLWLVIAFVGTYSLTNAISIFAQLSGALSLDSYSIIINATSLLLSAVCLYKLFNLSRGALMWINILFLFSFVTKLIGIGLTLLAYSPLLRFTQVFPNLITSLLLLVILWVYSYRWTLRYIKSLPGDLNPSTSSMVTARIYSVSIIIASIVVLIAGPAAQIYYVYGILPASKNVAVQKAITDTLVDALAYSQKRSSLEQNYSGYHPTQAVEIPSCSRPLIVHVSPDGGRVAVFGMSCTASGLYYCSALPIENFGIGMGMSFNESMPTIPARLVVADKFDCRSSASPEVVTNVESKTPSTPGVLIITFDWNLPTQDMEQTLRTLGATNCKKNWPNNFWSFLCSVPVGKEDQIMTAAKAYPGIQSTGRSWGGPI